MLILLTVLHVAVSFFLIIVVLLQSGKAADLAGAFGGMGSQTAFGARGAATILSKATTGAAVLFMLTSITLGIYQGKGIGAGQSVIERSGIGTEEGAAPAPTPSAPTPAQTQAVEGLVPEVQVTPAGGESAEESTGESQ